MRCSVLFLTVLGFQRRLSPYNFDSEAAKAALGRARESVKGLPTEEIAKVRLSHMEKIEKLEATYLNETNSQKKDQLKKQADEMKLALEGLDLLAHAPAYCRLMEGVFELVHKRSAEAKSIFDEVEKMDPEYANKATTQLKQLREMADLPETTRKEQSWIKSLLREIGYSAAAIAAGALVVVATGWSGPAALAAGFAAGAGVRSGLKYMVEGELEWHDPLIGGIDGFSGGAGALIRKSSLNTLNNSARMVGSAENALRATGMDVTALQGLQGTERIQRARMLSGQGLSQMGKDLSWMQRHFSGGPLYGQARGAVTDVGFGTFRNEIIADAAGGAATSILFRGRQYFPQFVSPDHAFSDTLLDYSRDVTTDTMFSGAGSFLLAPFNKFVRTAPMIYGARDLSFKSPMQEMRLEEIELLLTELDAPITPSEVRRLYIVAPGPKVEPLPQK